jgi:putative PIN family toxin of toxin-antitoxin system
MKIVLDTNVLISGIFWNGLPRKVVSLWAKNKIQLLITKQIFNEFIRISKKIDNKGIATNKWAVRIIKNSIIVPDKELTTICRDPEDNKFLNCALVGNADYVISGDNDLLILKAVGSTKIVSPAQFLKHFHY